MFHRLCGYANGLSFKNITETDISFVENFVQNELKDLLQQKCDRFGAELDVNEMENIFGMYANCETEFKLMRGDRLLLKEIAEFLNELFTTEGTEAFARHFEVPKRYKMSKSDTEAFSFGTFYSKKQRLRVKINLSKDEMITQLYTMKLKPFFETYKNLKPFRVISEDLINIVDLKTGVRADVICVFCSSSDSEIDVLTKKYAIQCDKSGNWNISNLKKHVEHQHCGKNSDGIPESTDARIKSSTGVKNTALKLEVRVKRVESKNVPSLKVDSSASPNRDETVPSCDVNTENKPLDDDSRVADSTIDRIEREIMSMPVICAASSQNLEDSIQIDQNSSLSSCFYDAFSTQNLKLIEANLVNLENKKFMSVQVDERCYTVNILDIKQDGNCMFSTLVHQLSYVKNNSENHTSLTMRLRENVVSHIERNLKWYRQYIKGRLRCDDATDEICSDFLQKLSKDGFWGDAETLMAVTKMYEVNIFIFSEKGSCYFACGFKPEYNRTIFMAYRFNGIDEQGERNYNHYDTVCEVDEELLYRCANSLSARMTRPNDITLQ